MGCSPRGRKESGTTERLTLTYLSAFPIRSPAHLRGVRNPQRVPSLWQSFPNAHRHWPPPAMTLLGSVWCESAVLTAPGDAEAAAGHRGR